MKKQNNPSYVLFIIMLAIPLSGIGVDLYAPALPAMALAFQVTPAAIKMTISAYLVGICIGQIISGTLSDSLGRKPTQIFGATLFFIASYCVTLSPTINVMLVFRFLQGFGSGAISSAARSQIPDLFSKEKTKHIAVYLAIAWGIGPIIAPWIGGYLQHYFGWRSCFYFYTFYGLMLFTLMTFVLKESIQAKTHLNLNQLMSNYKIILTHPQFMAALILMGIFYVILVLFGILGPFIIQVNDHFSAVTYGYFALFVGAAYLSGTLTGRALSWISEHLRLQCTLYFVIILSLVFCVLSLFVKNVMLYVSYAFIVNFCMGITFPICFALSMTVFREMSGTVSALAGSGIMLIAGVLSALIGLVHVTSVCGVILIYLALSVLCLLVYLLMLKKHFAQ